MHRGSSLNDPASAGRSRLRRVQSAKSDYLTEPVRSGRLPPSVGFGCARDYLRAYLKSINPAIGTSYIAISVAGKTHVRRFHFFSPHRTGMQLRGLHRSAGAAALRDWYSEPVSANSLIRPDSGPIRRRTLTATPSAVKISHLTGVLRSATHIRQNETNPTSIRVIGGQR